MQYFALLSSDPAREAVPGTPEWDVDMRLYERFGEIAGAAIVTGEALDQTTVSTVRADGVVTAGPFAEGVEVAGGVYVLDVPGLDEAIQLAREIPAALHGAVELRPLVEPWFEADSERPAGDRYLALIWAPETDAERPGTPEWEEGMAAHGAFGRAAGAAVRGGGALHPGDTATVVRVRDGELLVTDGPHAEATEVIGGVYVLSGATRAEAEALAATIPLSPGGAVELYPVLELGG